MTNDTTSHTGVVDPSILNVEDDGGIPTFLRRTEQLHHAASGNHGTDEPVFTTETQPDGQVALTVDQGEGVLASLPDQPESGHAAAFEQQLADAGVTTEGNNETVSEELPPTNHNQPADPAKMRRDFFKDINSFGKASGEGASALGRLGVRALRAAADGVISTAKPQGGGKDDATLIYEAYTAMDSKHAEHTAGGAKANASKLRQIIAMGCMTTITDPVAVGDKVIRVRERMEGADLKPKALFAGLVDVARAQTAADTELTETMIEELLTKTKADKTLEKEWEAIQKRVDGLISGEASHGLKDNSETAMKIGELINEHIKNYKLDGQRQEMIDNLVDHGYTVAQATAIVDKKAV